MTEPSPTKISSSNQSSNANKAPKWFLIISLVLVIWNLIGVMAFVAQMMMTPEQIAELPPAEQGLYQNIPLWVNLAFACAVFGGALGCLALCFKKAIALPVLVLSVMGVLVQMYHSFFIADSIEVYGPGAAVRPSMVTIIALFLLWLAKHAKSNSWIN